MLEKVLPSLEGWVSFTLLNNFGFAEIKILWILFNWAGGYLTGVNYHEQENSFYISGVGFDGIACCHFGI